MNFVSYLPRLYVWHNGTFPGGWLEFMPGTILVCQIVLSRSPPPKRLWDTMPACRRTHEARREGKVLRAGRWYVFLFLLLRSLWRKSLGRRQSIFV